MIQEYNGHGKNRMLCSIKCLCYSNKEPTLVVIEEGNAGASVLNVTPFHVDKMISCQPETEARATQATMIESRHARTQTDAWSARGIIPIPVPIYVPQPCFIPTPYPSPVPFVLPIVIPIIMAVSNLLGRFTMKKQKDEYVGTSVGRISDVTSTIYAPPLNSTRSASENSEQVPDFNQTSYYGSCNDDQTSLLRQFETSTPCGSVAGEFLCDNDPVMLDSDGVGKSRRLKPDALLDAGDLKNEDESNFPQETTNLAIGMRIKRSFSCVESDDMENNCNAAKKPKESLLLISISQDGEI